jgi:GNAT superfamily N-acetyltransferase
MPTITYRPATFEDTRLTYEIFEESIMDLSQRFGYTAVTGGDDPEVLENLWVERRPLFEHLQRTAAHCWIAETNGKAIGFARSIIRNGVFELTDFFVRPSHQSVGIGRELLSRTFPPTDMHRIIIATSDMRAVIRYLKSGVYPRFPIYYFSRTPQTSPLDTDLHIQPLAASPDHIGILNTIDQHIMGYQRPTDHQWLLENRTGHLYYRDGQPVGYAYTGEQNGPFALLNETDFPAVLTHAENQAAPHNYEFGVEVPMINRAALQHLLSRRFQASPFFTFFMTDHQFGDYQNYIFTSPPFFS